MLRNKLACHALDICTLTYEYVRVRDCTVQVTAPEILESKKDKRLQARLIDDRCNHDAGEKFFVPDERKRWCRSIPKFAPLAKLDDLLF